MKPETALSKVDRLILEEASEWFVDFRVGDIDQHSRERFDEWLRRSPEHIRAYMDIAKTYVELPSLPFAGNMDVDSLIAYAHSAENVVPFDTIDSVRAPRPQSTTADTPQRERPITRAAQPPRRRLRIAAASVLALTIAGAVWWQTERFPSYATDIGERRSITLPDGSTVDLNARSKLRIEFSPTERRVELLAGQVLFQVSKDRNRPFIVASGAATVRAVGTQFDVNRKAGETTVTVLEGRVAVYATARPEPSPSGSGEPPSGSAPNAPSLRASPQSLSPTPPLASPLIAARSRSSPSNPAGLTDPSGAAAIFLSAGEQVTVMPAQILPAPAHVDIAAATAWRQRRLIFDGTRLSDVVEEFNRYNRRQLIIDGTQLSDFRVSGVYSSTDPASLVRFLRQQPGMKITEEENEVRVSAP